MKQLITFFMAMCMATTVLPQSGTKARHVSVQEFKTIMDSLQDEIVLDLRTPGELKKGKIPHARHIDFYRPDFESVIARLDKNRAYLVYCASGGRSGDAAGMMEKMGFRKIYNLTEGFNGWVRKDMPVVENR